MRTYTQLTWAQRYQIYALLKMGHNRTEIAGVIGVHLSSISRELKHNHGQRGYRPKPAHALAVSRRKKAKPCILPETWGLIDGLIRQDWSPEQVSGRLESKNNIRVSHEWIYQHILADKRVGGDLYRHLRCQKKRRKRYGSYDRRGILPNRVSIDERPEVVDSRARLGDWEVNTIMVAHCATIIGKGRQPALVTLTERKSRLTLVRKVERKTAEAVAVAVVTLLMPWKAKTHTLTSDHGKEFTLHQIIAKLIETDYFFAHPYAAWERGTNENTNGLLHQYFPKKCDLQTVSDDKIEFVMCNLNNRPRKTLAYRVGAAHNTPFEVFLSCRTYELNPQTETILE